MTIINASEENRQTFLCLQDETTEKKLRKQRRTKHKEDNEFH